MNPIWKMTSISKWAMAYVIGIIISTLQTVKPGGQIHNDHKMWKIKQWGNFRWIWVYNHSHLLLLRVHTDDRLLLDISR